MPDNSSGSRRPVDYQFNAKSRDAQRWAKRYAGKRITNLNTETKRAVRKVVTDSIRDGVPPRDAAKQIREMVGLNRPQGIALRRYVGGLSPSLTTAAKEKAGIRLKNKMIRRRAITIARTEVIDSLSAGVEKSWQQAQGKGLLGKNAKKEWVTTPVGACAVCRAMNGQIVPLAKNFESDLGPLARPTAHPNCRCGIAPVPGVGGMLTPTATPPTATPRMPLTADGLIIRGSDARRAILKHADAGTGLKHQQIRDAAEKQLHETDRALQKELNSVGVDGKLLNKTYKGDAEEIQAALWRAQSAGDNLEAARLEKLFRKREREYSERYRELKTKHSKLNAELRVKEKAVELAINTQSDDVLETFIYNKTKNGMLDTSTVLKLTKADHAELDRGIDAFRRLVDDGIYTTTVEGTPANTLAVGQPSKVHVEFIKNIVGSPDTKRSRAFAYSDRDRAYRVKLNYKTRTRLGRGTTVHELTHTAELADPSVLAEAIRWRDSLTTDDTLEWLGKLTGNKTYAFDELAYGDGAAFKDKYIGKVYTKGRDPSKVKGTNNANQFYTPRDGWQTSTEVSTMGMQAMYQDPVAFAREMPELFDFVYERIIRRKYTGATSRYALQVGRDFKLTNTPTSLTPSARKQIIYHYELQAISERRRSSGTSRPGTFAQRLFQFTE